jgi:hypothetical protein
MTAVTAIKASWSQVVRQSALCGLWLIMPIPVAGALATIANWFSAPEEIAFSIFSIGVIFFHAVAGAFWARGLGRIFGWQSLSRLGWAGAFGIALPTLIAIIVLGQVEQELIQFTFDGWRMHVLYALLFVPTTFLIAAVGTGVLGLAIGDPQLAWRLALVCGLAAALTFLVVAVLFDFFGMRVGAPGAEERATMLVVTLAGMWAAALVGNGALAWLVERRQAV